MKIISKDVTCDENKSGKTVYKATFTTEEGVIHRVDFNDRGRIENLCEYTAYTPDIHVDDLKRLIGKIEAEIAV